jgi:cysteinyl-tRNA synthetase
MSKSLGNTVSIPVMLEKVRAPELRYYLVGPHYRSHVEYSPEALDESVSAYRRIESFLRRVVERTGAVENSGELAEPFVTAMDDDISTPGALAAIHRRVREGNTALEAGDDRGARAAAGSVRAMTDLLGLDPLSERWHDASTSARGGAGGQALGVLVDRLLEERQQARRERDFARADALRDHLLLAGIAVEDTPDGPKWTLKDD